MFMKTIYFVFLFIFISHWSFADVVRGILVSNKKPVLVGKLVSKPIRGKLVTRSKEITSSTIANIDQKVEIVRPKVYRGILVSKPSDFYSSRSSSVTVIHERSYSPFWETFATIGLIGGLTYALSRSHGHGHWGYSYRRYGRYRCW